MHKQFEHRITIAVSLTSAVLLAVLALAGPLAADLIHYRVSPRTLNHIKAHDVTNLFLAIPVSLGGAFLTLRKNPGAKFLLVMPGMYLMYCGAALGLGQEWSSPLYDAKYYNSSRFFWLFLLLMINGLLLSYISVGMFKPRRLSIPDKKRRLFLAATIALLLLLFALLWLADIFAALKSGESLFHASYRGAPAAFWLIKYFDLGFAVPLAGIGLYQFIVRPVRGYRLILLYFGFSMMMLPGTLVVRYLNGLFFDPGTVIILFYAIFIYAGFFYLAKIDIAAKRRPPAERSL